MVRAVAFKDPMTLLNRISVVNCLCPLTVGGLQIISCIHYDYKTTAHERICSLKKENCHNLLTFMSFKTCMSVFCQTQKLSFIVLNNNNNNGNVLVLCFHTIMLNHTPFISIWLCVVF